MKCGQISFMLKYLATKLNEFDSLLPRHIKEAKELAASIDRVVFDVEIKILKEKTDYDSTIRHRDYICRKNNLYWISEFSEAGTAWAEAVQGNIRGNEADVKVVLVDRDGKLLKEILDTGYLGITTSGVAIISVYDDDNNRETHLFSSQGEERGTFATYSSNPDQQQGDILGAFDESGEHYRFIKSTGEPLNDSTYGRIVDFSEGFGWGEATGWWYLVDENGNNTYIRDVKSPKMFSEGLAVSYTGPEKYIVVDTQGKTKFTFEGTVLANGYKDGLLLVQKYNDFHFYYLDKEGHFKLGPYKGARSFSDGFAIVGRESKQYFIDANGVEKFGPFVSALDFSEGYAVVETAKDQYSLLDTQGNITKVKKYQYIEEFRSGVSEATDYSGEKSFLDHQGRQVFGHKIERISRTSKTNPFEVEPFV
ncbi:MAG: hypothetical protein NTW50_05360 [Candidatus Berkelbacteria bacterium]|nr:hypothetical protein [Candidatus Berkelbacteria bacterium]